MLTKHHAQRGVSLIELMVGVTIVAIVLTLGAPSFSTFIQNSQIRTASEVMQTGLSLAKAEAVRRNTTVKFDLVGDDSSWKVGCVTASDDCPDSIQTRTAAEGSRNVSVTATDATLSFNGLGRVTTTLASGTTATFNITNPNGGTCSAAGGTMRCLRVVVTLAGQIRMCDPKLTSSNPSDPQAC